MKEALIAGAAAIIVCVINNAVQISQIRKTSKKATAVVQGVLCAALSTFVNQLIKQSKKDE